MPVYILLLVAVVPILAMVATAGNALGRNAQLAAVIALLSAVVAWLVVGTLRTVFGTWRRVKPSLTSGDTNIYLGTAHRREVTKSAR
jgi:uncharacterized membrane protein